MSGKQLQVAILMSEMSVVKSISGIFRKIGVLAHFYDSLQSFAEGIKEGKVDLTIIDVVMMSERERLLKDIPQVKSEEVPLVFYHKKETAPLLFSTFELFNFGSIVGELPLEPQIKSVLKRINKMQQGVRFKELYEEKQIEQKKRISLWEKSKKKIEQEKSMLEDFLTFFPTPNDKLHFTELLGTLIDRIGAVESFSYFVLDASETRVISPVIGSKKYLRGDTIFLGQKASKGLDHIAQNLIGQFSLELLAGGIVNLSVKGNEVNPSAVVAIRVSDEDYLSKFPWSELESLLSLLYTRSQLYKDLQIVKRQKGIQGQNLYDFFEKLGKELSSALFVVDLTSLHNYAHLKRCEVRWSELYWDLVSKITSDKNCSVAQWSTKQLLVSVKHKENSDYLDKLKGILAHFPLRLYVEELSLDALQRLIPIVMMAPNSILGVEKTIESIGQRTLQSGIRERRADLTM